MTEAGPFRTSICLISKNDTGSVFHGTSPCASTYEERPSIKSRMRLARCWLFPRMLTLKSPPDISITDNPGTRRSSVGRSVAPDCLMSSAEIT